MKLPALLLLAFAAAAQADPRADVFAAERAFADAMARRDQKAFVAAISEEAIFFGDDPAKPLRGRDEIFSRWIWFFDGPKAPFSWEPDQVEVLASGTLALSTGIVRNMQGKPVQRFSSIWRLEAPGVWRVVFDKGGPLGAADADSKP